ncbi:MAG TPA: cell division protein FtsA [Clostridiales bacterium]|nr:cell division protein FtsA [Clostridiales bacterium]
MEHEKYPEHLVFGLDIGTRSIVGTVGYRKQNNQFVVIAQCMREHETRAMIDGQIHDIEMVSETIRNVKEELEKQVGRKLTEVCIAAAGRVLKTVQVSAEYDFASDTTVNEEHIQSLDLIGVEKAYDTLREELKEEKINFYCVGYSVINYTLNGYSIAKLNGHKASKIGTNLLATFLPDEVINGLYAAVEEAGLQVVCITLEPIAAINVAIPERFRLLNIAMVDVGAGTSDISITKDGSIVAYGMIPYAGDEITEAIAQKYLVEFNVAETMKTSCLKKKSVSFKDVMGIKSKITTEEILGSVDDIVHKITKSVAEKIVELNGGKSVSAVFVVGGGGKIPGFVTSLANYLELPQDRVALRGEEVLGNIIFLQEKVKKDSLLVTPIGICLTFYEKSNNFIFVTVNGVRVKLYDNDKLTVSDAAVQMGYPNEKLFPRRGKPINFTLNGSPRMVRGELGEAAQIRLNGENVGLNHRILQNDKIEITESTVGGDAVCEIGQLPEYHSTITIYVNGSRILCPKFIEVNGTLVSEYYSIQDQDEVQMLSYYTLQQVLEFMDIQCQGEILVNNKPAGMEEKVYENFTITCNLNNNQASDDSFAEGQEDMFSEEVAAAEVKTKEGSEGKSGETAKGDSSARDIYVTVNSTVVKLEGKENYIFVDIFDFYHFDLSVMQGTELVTEVNGIRVDFTAPLQEGDHIQIYWR